VKTEVLRQVGFIHQEFSTLEGASLEWGYRCLTHGVICRHLPWLLPDHVQGSEVNLPLADELRFIYYHYDRKWLHWAVIRSLWTGYALPVMAFQAWREARQASKQNQLRPYPHEGQSRNTEVSRKLPKYSPRVTVLIPTMQRYHYLRKLLCQLRKQTVRPYEIIIIDQTKGDDRQPELYYEFADLPLKLIFLNRAGQCFARNAGLQAAEGEYILFVDDDVEIPNNLIHLHLDNLSIFRAQVSSGVADEIGGSYRPEAFTCVRSSDVFPAGNTLIHRSVLHSSGLFDLAYDHGQRADGDLGVRIYLSGALMVVNPKISVLHHHAPRGGLRVHKARVITYASSRHKLTHRRLPSISEFYLQMRYGTLRQIREMKWLAVLGTFRLKGPRWRQILKILLGLCLLPQTLLRLHLHQRAAIRMFEKYPQIPSL